MGQQLHLPLGLQWVLLTDSRRRAKDGTATGKQASQGLGLVQDAGKTSGPDHWLRRRGLLPLKALSPQEKVNLFVLSITFYIAQVAR